MDRVDVELNQHLDQQEKAEQQYERVVREYLNTLELKWPQTQEGQAAIAEAIAENCESIAALLCSGNWSLEAVELASMVTRMAERNAEAMIEDCAISRVIDVCENAPYNVSLETLERAREEIGSVN